MASVTVQSLIAVARLLCPWQPDVPPPTILLDDGAFELVFELIGADHIEAKEARGVLRRKPSPHIFLRARTATDQILCHEWRHFVDPTWRHD